MPDLWKRLTSIPIFKDTQKTRQAAILSRALYLALAFSPFFGVFHAVAGSGLGYTAGILVFVDTSILIAFYFLKRGKISLASRLFLGSIWLGLSADILLNGGLYSPEISTLILIIAISGYFLNGTARLLYSSLCLLTLVGSYVLQQQGLLPLPMTPNSPGHVFILQLLNLALAAIVIYFVSLRLRNMMETSARNERTLINKNRELEEIRASLERRISERTADISQEKLFYEALVQNSPLAIVSVDLEHRITACNPAFEQLFGYRLDEMLGRDLDEFVLPQERRDEAKVYTDQVLRGEKVHATAQRMTRSGRWIDVEIFGVPVFVENRRIGILGMYRDITEYNQAMEALRESEERFRTFFEYASTGMVICSLEGKYLQVNQAFSDIVGYSRDELLAMDHQQLTYPEDLRAEQAKTQELLEGVLDFYQIEKRYLHKDDSIIWALLNISLLRNAAGQPSLIIGQIQDITKRKATEERLKYLATHDPLTGLPNRALYFDRLDHALILARRNRRRVAVLFLDLDTFKTVNDTLGHDVGDRLLQSVAGRLRRPLRKSDTVARFGGDEFAFIIENITLTDDVPGVIHKIQYSLQKPFKVNGYSFKVSSSIGASLYPQDGEDGKTLFMRADQAMYRAKEGGKDNYAFFSKPG